jgi:hypothetical protein
MLIFENQISVSIFNRMEFHTIKIHIVYYYDFINRFMLRFVIVFTIIL